VDEQDNVVGHESKYNCKILFCSANLLNFCTLLMLFELVCGTVLDLLFVMLGHLMEKIDSENLLHRAFSVFLFNSKYELLLQVCFLFLVLCISMMFFFVYFIAYQAKVLNFR
jgi:isopentenyl-diphosphate Delta-isomerase